MIKGLKCKKCVGAILMMTRAVLCGIRIVYLKGYSGISVIHGLTHCDTE